MCPATKTSCISIHAPPRGATTKNEQGQLSFLFQFTPLREGRRHSSSPPLHGFHFNSRPSARGDRSDCYCFYSIKHFNSRPSARGDGNAVGAVSYYVIFQFTPLREGRRERVAQSNQQSIISIHAPPRGATRSSGFLEPQPPISIHAPPRGATAQTGKELMDRVFQFTPLREGRPVL